LTPAALRAAVDRVATDPSFAERVTAMRREIAAGGGAVRAADVVEALLPAHRLAEEAPVGLG
jgi:UDP:flavonoid glycosyltransferase YjiC (YdhE family)